MGFYGFDTWNKSIMENINLGRLHNMKMEPAEPLAQASGLYGCIPYFQWGANPNRTADFHGKWMMPR